MGLVNLVPARVTGPGTVAVAGGLSLTVALPAGAGDNVEVAIRPERRDDTAFDLFERVRIRAAAVARETLAISESFAEPGPRKGPPPG